MEQKIYVEGLTSAEDEQKAQKAVCAVNGVENCTVSFEKAQVLVNYDANTTNLETIRNAIHSCGFFVLG